MKIVKILGPILVLLAIGLVVVVIWQGRDSQDSKDTSVSSYGQYAGNGMQTCYGSVEIDSDLFSDPSWLRTFKSISTIRGNDLSLIATDNVEGDTFQKPLSSKNFELTFEIPGIYKADGSALRASLSITDQKGTAINIENSYRVGIIDAGDGINYTFVEYKDGQDVQNEIVTPATREGFPIKFSVKRVDNTLTVYDGAGNLLKTFNSIADGPYYLRFAVRNATDSKHVAAVFSNATANCGQKNGLSGDSSEVVDCGPIDSNGDGKVGLMDFAKFAKKFGAGCK